jgi:hypothetical protein
MQKCDAERPCTSCIGAKTVTECVYDNERRPQPAGIYPSRRANSHLSGQQPRGPDPVEIPTAILYYSPGDGAFADVPPPANLDRAPSTSSDATWVVANKPAAQQVFWTDQVPHEELVRVHGGPLEQCVSLDTSPPAFTIPSFFLQTILREPLSFLGEEKPQLQISDATATDLDMKSYVLEWESISHNLPSDISRLWYLVRLPQLGIRFSRAKVDAFISGDLSGAVLHRAFVLQGQMLGFLSFADETPAMVLFHARRVQTTWEALADLFSGIDYKAKVHSASTVVPGFIYLRMPQMALLYIRKSCEFVQAGNLQFVPTDGHLPKFSEDLHETLVALSQTIYWANYLFLTCGGLEPYATAKLEWEFRQELPVGDIASILSYIELIFDCSELTRLSLISVL